MTKAFLRVQRNGEWMNLEVEYLTDEERNNIFSKKTGPELMCWLNLVCNILAEQSE